MRLLPPQAPVSSGEPIQTFNPIAFPGFQLINDGVKALKDGMEDAQRGLSFKKVSCYLGYRFISYTFIPTIANAISALVSVFFAFVTLPFRYCCKEINNYLWTRSIDSLECTFRSLVDDVAFDLRWVMGCLCA